MGTLQCLTNNNHKFLVRYNEVKEHGKAFDTRRVKKERRRLQAEGVVSI